VSNNQVFKPGYKLKKPYFPPTYPSIPTKFQNCVVTKNTEKGFGTTAKRFEDRQHNEELYPKAKFYKAKFLKKDFNRNENI